MLALGYISLALIMAIIILVAFNTVLKNSGIEKADRQKRLLYVIGGFTLWTVHMLIMDWTDALNSFELPPRFPLFLIFPLFAFTGFFLYRNQNNRILHAIPKSWPVYYQSFRTFFVPSIWGSSTPLANEGVFSFEFMLVPGFLMPSAVFMHILSIIQLRKSIVEERIKTPALSL